MKRLMRYRIISGRTTEVRDVLMEPASIKKPRNRKARKSNEKQILRNETEATLCLARIFNCNFQGGDLFLTLKYDDGRLPATKEEAKRLLRNFIRRISRAYQKMTGKKLLWVAVTADRSFKTGKPVRLHHHLVLKAVDWEVIAANWPADQFSYRRLDASGDYKGIAVYMIRNAGYGGGRAWSTSQGMKKPKYTTPIPVTRLGGVRIPPEARVVEREVKQDSETGFAAAYIRFVEPLDINKSKGKERKDE